jgi:hypothetical protein
MQGHNGHHCDQCHQCVLRCRMQEAGYCCRGTDGCNAVMRLTVQDELWAAVNRGDGALVRQHLTPLRLTPTQVRLQTLQSSAHTVWWHMLQQQTN